MDNRRILIIDDNREIHEDIKKILGCNSKASELDLLEMEILGTPVRKSSFPEVTIDSALQGQEGVNMGFQAWKEGNPYALAFVDVRMPPGLDGIETIQRLRSFDKELQFVIITAYSDYGWDQINRAVDSDDALLILKKPFDSVEIRQMTHALTQKWALARGLKEKTQVLQEINQTLQVEIEERVRLEQSRQILIEELETHIRELNCFYELTRLTQESKLDINGLFRQFVGFIPPAFRHPDLTFARLTCKDIDYTSEGFRETSTMLTSPISDHVTPIGSIDVFLDPSLQRGNTTVSFSASEQALVNVLADQMTKTVERIRAEQQVKESEKQIRLIMNSTAEGIFGLDLEGKCIFCNRSCIKTLGYDTVEELLGKPLHDLVHHTRESGESVAHEDCGILKSCSRQIETHQPRDLFWKKDHTSFPVEFWTYPIYKNRAVIGVVVTFIDITERILAEQEKEKYQQALRQAQKMEAIGTLAGGIAHDFNNILFPLLGYAELLNNDLPQGSPLSSYTDEILNAALRAKDLVKQILTFSRQARHEPKLIQPYLIVNEALKLLRAGISTKIKIVKNLQKDCGVVKADPTHLHQIVMNLVTNAFHAMEEDGGVLTVGLSQVTLPAAGDSKPGLPAGIYACLTVEDTGPGIPEALQSQIFDPYFTTKEQGKGTGLGLSVVQGIVKTLKGEIVVRSAQGRGAWFGIYLPIDGEAQTPVPKPSKDIVGGTERILIVDDEQTVVKIQETLLKRLGYETTPILGSIRALERFSLTPGDFDLVITDLNMPDMDGLLLAKKIRDIRPEIPIILCTGFFNLVSREKCQENGITEVVLKPVIYSELASAIRRVMENGQTGLPDQETIG